MLDGTVPLTCAVASSPIALAGGVRIGPDSGKPCLNVHTQYIMYAASLLDDQPTVVQRLLCALGTQPVGKGSFPENFNIKIFALPSTSGSSLWYNRAGRLRLAGSARGGCVPAAGGWSPFLVRLHRHLVLSSWLQRHSISSAHGARGSAPR